MLKKGAIDVASQYALQEPACSCRAWKRRLAVVTGKKGEKKELAEKFVQNRSPKAVHVLSQHSNSDQKFVAVLKTNTGWLTADQLDSWLHLAAH